MGGCDSFETIQNSYCHTAKSMDYLVFCLHYRATKTSRESLVPPKSDRFWTPVIACALQGRLCLSEPDRCGLRRPMALQDHPPRITLQDAAGSFSTSGSALDTSGIVTQF